MTARYKSPEVAINLTKEEIQKRYQDTAMIIFKEEQRRKQEVINYLSFGNSRRTTEYSSNGNHPVIIRKPAGSIIMQDIHLSSQILREHRKPEEKCAVS
ncbi:hypothetical protein DMN91_006498 [Ooceraea biroi]|uniref:Uncharacterized protein n=1 Tax=Ooceraea biroi TaxID=2015173 RepID=A0A026WDX3_OOCBI|nr:hypothetical protein X777_06180 [Ooceraea biroi]RLU22118.1 hypothetical protein DMN91_006498 [Ooceraea biroi]